MTSPGRSRSHRRAFAAVAATLVLAAAVLAGLFLRGRGQSARPTPAAAPPERSSGPAWTPGPRRPEVCSPGKSGPLRQDTQFIANDGVGTVVHYSISLPADYYSACEEYPVIYALHGKTENNVNFLDQSLTMRKAMAAGVLEQSIIVTPDSYVTGRWENRETGPAEDNFIKQLIPFIEQNYRVRSGPSHRVLVGFSMGGHGAIRFGLKYPQMFAAVWSVDGAMSGAENYLPYVAGKTSDTFRISCVGGRLNGQRVQALVDALKQRGIDIPYVYQDREHEFTAFVDEDEKTGWHAMRFLQQGLVAARPS